MAGANRILHRPRDQSGAFGFSSPRAPDAGLHPSTQTAAMAVRHQARARNRSMGQSPDAKHAVAREKVFLAHGDETRWHNGGRPRHFASRFQDRDREWRAARSAFYRNPRASRQFLRPAI